MTGDVELRNVRDTNVGNVFQSKFVMSLIYATGNFVLIRLAIHIQDGMPAVALWFSKPMNLVQVKQCTNIDFLHSHQHTTFKYQTLT